ncbi:unnamed protein product [Ambrosiozyma monospora]|uniref:Unnamed protein product n=1 Tax=Ambrosiozyma monospora TaxID=43982 RepID=A0ACB5TCF3_AMBMO|nr:unnamed protein product [Ambrosiozyma monospora]
MSRPMLVSFNTLKHFIKAGSRKIKTEIEFDQQLQDFFKDVVKQQQRIQGYESEDIEESEDDDESNRKKSKKKSKRSKATTTKKIPAIQIKNFMDLLNSRLTKQYANLYNRQAIHDVTNQVLTNESTLNKKKKLSLIALNEYLTVFNGSDNKNLPDLQGSTKSPITSKKRSNTGHNKQNQRDDDGEVDNIYLKGFLNIKKRDILQLIDELPSSNKLSTTDIGLIEEYDETIENLNANRRKLLMMKQKLKTYQNLKMLLSRSLPQLQKNLLIGSNDELSQEVSNARILIPLVMDRLEDESVVDGLKKRMVNSLDQMDG